MSAVVARALARRGGRALALGAAVLLAGCGGVQIAPVPTIPKALVVAAPVKVGVVIGGDMRNYAHNETRGGVSWNIALGEGHVQHMRALYGAGFREVVEFPDLESARAAPGLSAIFEPRIDQYSFATTRDTGGEYVAVTIRYRINLFAPDGQPVDSFTLTGYGSGPGGGLSSSEPLTIATLNAMRDATAKFLTQFPAQQVAQRLERGDALVGTAQAAPGGGPAPLMIEAVAVREQRRPPPPVVSR
jgi:hypothetical protein